MGVAIIKVLLDGRLISNKPTGISRYSREMVKIYQNYYGYENVKVLINEELEEKPFKYIKTDLKPFNIGHFFKIHKVIEKVDADIYHSLFYSNSYIKVDKVKYITTVHDLMYLEVKNFFGKSFLKNIVGKIYYNFLVKKSLKNSDKIIAVSRTTKEDIKRYFNQESIVVVEGVNELTTNEKEIEKLKNEKFYLYVGNSRPHKNLNFLINTYKELDIEIKLVLVGTGNKINIQNEKILTLGFVDDEELIWLYKKCRAFIFPSLYEGFGLPILEALNNGATVYSSNKGSLKEFSEKVIYFFNPYKKEELKKLLQKNPQIVNQEQKEQLLKEYTWGEAEKQMVKIFKNEE